MQVYFYGEQTHLSLALPTSNFDGYVITDVDWRVSFVFDPIIGG